MTARLASVSLLVQTFIEQAVCTFTFMGYTNHQVFYFFHSLAEGKKTIKFELFIQFSHAKPYFSRCFIAESSLLHQIQVPPGAESQLFGPFRVWVPLGLPHLHISKPKPSLHALLVAI